jgi:cystathionine beta-lyase
VTYDFTTPVDRRGSGAIKYDRRPELDPFWVADMDFQSAPEILEAMHKRVDHGVFGYAQAHEGLVGSVLDYLQRRHQYKADASELIHLGGMVPALSLAGRAFAKPGDSMLTCTPVYPPFLGVHKDSELHLKRVAHVRDDQGRWSFDWDGLEQATDETTRVFILCHPQNPLGRVFSPDELERLAAFCERHDLILLADEIHCDLVLDEHSDPFVSALRLPERFHDRLVVLQSPSKTWNIAGLGYAYAVIPNDSLRRRYSASFGHTLPEINAISFYAAEAAYRHGEPWRLALLDALRKNRATLERFLRERVPAVRYEPGAATFLAWIDGSALGVPSPARHFEENAGLFLSDGAFFGAPDHFRFNFGCPESRLLEGLEKLEKATL